MFHLSPSPKKPGGLNIDYRPSSILSDIYVRYLEEIPFDECNFKRWFRFVYNTFVFFDKNTNFSGLITLVNFINLCIQFTYEEECNNKLPFLIFWF